MFYKNFLSLIIFVILANCTAGNLLENKPSVVIVNGYSNKGFALVYNEDLYKKKIINNKIDERSLIVFQKNLKVNSQVKITNILNNKSLIASVGKKSIYPSFNNVVLSIRIAEELDLDIDQPYVEVLKQYISDNDNHLIDGNLIGAIITPDKDIIPNAESLEPAYIVFENFEKILQWNRSLRFGLAVCTLKGKFENAL